MSCPSTLELEAYLDVGSEVGIGPHVRSCPQCQAELKRLRTDQDFLNQCRSTQRPSTKAEPDAPEGYDLLHVIGRGGQAVVYEAIQLSTRRHVALKLVRLGTRDVARRRRRFERESELVSNLRHPSIVTVFDSGITSEGDPYLVMELVAGEPIAYRPDATLTERLLQFRQVCAAIQHAHQHGVVHRDIKPSNILVDRNGVPRVLDFGLATTVENRESLTLTRSGEFLGTPIYAAPEQLRGASATPDVRTDVYALGVLLYQLLTGSHPFTPGSALADIVNHILERAPSRPSSVTTGLNNEVDTIVMKALAKEPERRYATVAALDADIDRFLRGEPLEARRDSAWYTLRKTAHRHRWAFGGAIAFLVLLMTFGIVMAVLYRSASETSRELEDALAHSKLDHGIDLARDSDLASAEPVLWKEYLKWVDTPEEIGTWKEGSLLHRRAYWALWEMYQYQPCVFSHQTGIGRMTNMGISPEEIIITDNQYGIHRWQRPSAGDRNWSEIPARYTHTQLPREGKHVAGMLSSDRRHFVTFDGATLTAFDLETLQPSPAMLVDQDAQINSWSTPVYGPHGLRVAGGCEDGTVRIWDLERQHAFDPICQATRPVYSVALLADGRLWSSSAHSERFMKHDLRTGVTEPSREYHAYDWVSVGLDGRYAQGNAIWEGFEERFVAALEAPPLARVNSYRFGESGHTIVGRGMTTPIWNAHTGELIRVLAAPQTSYAVVAEDDDLLVTTHADGHLRGWWVDPEQGRTRVPLGGSAHCVRFSPDGEQLLVCGATPDNEPILEIHRKGAPPLNLAALGLHNLTVSSVTWLSDTRFISGGHDGLLIDWEREDDTWSGTQVWDFGVEINEVATSTDQSHVGIACNDGRVIRWTLGRDPELLGKHAARVAALCFLNEQVLIAGGRGDHLKVWRTRRARAISEVSTTVRAVCHLPRPRRFVTAGDDQMIRMWRTNGTMLYESTSGARIFALAVSPDLSLIASGDASGDIRLWDVETGRPLANLASPPHMVFSLDFSPDGKTLASGGSDGALFYWDLDWFQQHVAGNLTNQKQKLADAPPQ